MNIYKHTIETIIPCVWGVFTRHNINIPPKKIVVKNITFKTVNKLLWKTISLEKTNNYILSKQLCTICNPNFLLLTAPANIFTFTIPTIQHLGAQRLEQSRIDPRHIFVFAKKIC